MIDYISFLLKNRVREKLLSYQGAKLWAKRLINAPELIRILFRSVRLSVKGAEIGELSVFGKNVELKGPAENLSIGRECFVGSRVRMALHDKITIGNNVVVNDGCIFLTASHDINSPDWGHVKSPIILKDYAWVATNSIILPGVVVGYGAIVGAGSVVTKNVPNYCIVAGNPARIVKERTLRHFEYSAVRFLSPFEAWVGLHGKARLDSDEQGK